MSHSPQALEAAARFDAQTTDIGNAQSIALENVKAKRRVLIAQRARANEAIRKALGGSTGHDS